MTLIVKTLSGNLVNLSETYPDTIKVLLFYNNACLGCTGRALPFAYKLKNEFHNVEIIGIHCDFTTRETPTQEIIDIFTDRKLPYPIYRDVDLNLYTKFRCEGTPHWILLNEEDQILNSIFGSQEGSQNRLMYSLTEVSESS